MVWKTLSVSNLKLDTIELDRNNLRLSYDELLVEIQSGCLSKVTHLELSACGLSDEQCARIVVRIHLWFMILIFWGGT